MIYNSLLWTCQFYNFTSWQKKWTNAGAQEKALFIFPFVLHQISHLLDVFLSSLISHLKMTELRLDVSRKMSLGTQCFICNDPAQGFCPECAQVPVCSDQHLGFHLPTTPVEKNCKRKCNPFVIKKSDAVGR